nr:MAG TPA: YopX protein [Caudoviricetes sp.]
MIPKFRAWDNELGRMMSIKNMWFQDSRIEELELNDAVMNEHITAYPDEIELMQSTGLKDKNGKEIFEGDILIVSDEHSWLEVVSYNQEKAMFVTEEINRKYKVPESPLNDLFDTNIFKFKVLGNIYENPELLEDCK